MSGVHIIALVSAVTTLSVIVELSRRRQLREKYAFLWLSVSVFVAVVAIAPGLFNRLAHAMAASGTGWGDHVALFLHNGTEYVEAMLACFKLRAVPLNVNYRYVADEQRAAGSISTRLWVPCSIGDTAFARLFQNRQFCDGPLK